ncbi:MAG: DMT family transporter [Acetivibrio sp.]
MVIFGTIGLFVRNIPLPSTEIALYRAFIAAAVLFIYRCIFKKRGKKISKKEAVLLFISGAIMGINWILLFQAYRYTTVSIATLSYYFAPVLVMAVSPFLFNEKRTKRQTFCFFMATIGLVLVIGIQKMEQTNTEMIGIAFGLGAAILYAIIILLNKKIQKVEGVDRTFYQFLAAGMVLLPYVLSTGTLGITRLEERGLVNLMILGIIHTGLAYCLYFPSLKELEGQKVAILSYVDPLTAILVSIFFLREPIGFWQIVGGIMILGFTLLSENKE